VLVGIGRRASGGAAQHLGYRGAGRASEISLSSSTRELLADSPISLVDLGFTNEGHP
jgi:hypothetical protein